MISDYFPEIKGLILDMDGVLWHDSQPLGDLPFIFDRIRYFGYEFILVTNNATRTVKEYQEKLAGFGVFLEANQIINTSEAVGSLLHQRYPDGANLFVIGQPSLKQTLESYGMKIVDDASSNVEVVIGSLDYDLTYEKLKHASLLIQSGCKFIGTNPDKTLPTPEGFIPGSGTVISALEVASGVKAEIVGKPEPLLFQIALERLALNPQDTLAIGDRLETDIAGAQAANIHSALVLSGASSQEEAQKFHPQPDIIAQNLTELVG